MKQANPSEYGFDRARLERIVRAIDADVEAERYDGAAVSVVRRGRIVLEDYRGFADRAGRRKLDRGAVFASLSVGKQFTVAIVLNRVERGDLRLMMPVCELIPEFGNRGKERMTLWHLLTHTSGIVSRIPAEVPPEKLAKIEGLVAWACETVPESLPGERVNYSILVAHSLMAEMVRRAEGSRRSFPQILEEDLFRPLGMNETSLGPRRDLLERLCPVVARFKQGLFAPEGLEGIGALLAMPGCEIPAGGYLTTLPDLTRFTEMLRNGGELDGARILSPAMIDFATRNHTGDLPNALLDYTVDFRRWDRFPASLGLGFFLRGEGVIPGPFSNLSSPRTFGGLGAGSTAFSVDPVYDVGLSFLSTGLMEDSVHMERVSRLSDIVVSAIVE